MTHDIPTGDWRLALAILTFLVFVIWVAWKDRNR